MWQNAEKKIIKTKNKSHRLKYSLSLKKSCIFCLYLKNMKHQTVILWIYKEKNESNLQKIILIVNTVVENWWIQ